MVLHSNRWNTRAKASYLSTVASVVDLGFGVRFSVQVHSVNVPSLWVLDLIVIGFVFVSHRQERSILVLNRVMNAVSLIIFLLLLRDVGARSFAAGDDILDAVALGGVAIKDHDDQ